MVGQQNPIITIREKIKVKTERMFKRDERDDFKLSRIAFQDNIQSEQS